MVLSNPSFLYAFALLVLPVIIHFFSLRKRRVVLFSNVAMLQEVKRSSSTTRNLRHWLILLARMFFMAALITAFAGPYLPSNALSKSFTKAVVLDNHPGMTRTNGSQSLIDEMKHTASEFIAAFEQNARFYIVTQGGRVHQIQTPESASKKMNELNVQNDYSQLHNLIQRVNPDNSEDDKAGEVFVFSDFRRGSFSLESIGADTIGNYFFIPLQHVAAANLSLDTCFFQSPIRRIQGEETMQVQVTNHSNRDFSSVAVKLYINDALSGITTVDIAAGGKIVSQINFAVPQMTDVWGRIEIDDGADAFDNILHFAYSRPYRTRVLALFGSDSIPHFTRLYKNIEGVEFKHENLFSHSPSDIEESDVIIIYNTTVIPSGFEQLIREQEERQLTLVLFPAAIQQESFNAFLNGLEIPSYGTSDTTKALLTHINQQDPFFSDIFETPVENIRLPQPKNMFNLLPKPGNPVIPLISGPNTSGLLYRLDNGNRQILLWATKAANPELSHHALFVVCMTRILFFRPLQQPLYYLPGQSVGLSFRFASRNQRLEVSGPSENFVPEIRTVGNITRLFSHNHGSNPGVYTIESDSQKIRYAVNISRAINNAQPVTADELEEMVESAGYSNIHVLRFETKADMNSWMQGMRKNSIWSWFIWAALIFLAVEVIFIQFWKR